MSRFRRYFLGAAVPAFLAGMLSVSCAESRGGNSLPAHVTGKTDSLALHYGEDVREDWLGVGFSKAVRLSHVGRNNIRLSEAAGIPHVLSAGKEYPDFFAAPYASGLKINYEGEKLGKDYRKSRSNMWNYADWDGDGVLDIVAGNSEGRLLFFKNNGTDREPDFAMSEEICAGGVPVLLRPGYHVVQGPFEASWGYLCPTVCDWNNDGLPDVVVSGSRQKYEVMLNEGTSTEPRLAAPVPIMVDNLELYGTWRVRPAIAKAGDVNVMVIMDDDNALHLYRQIDEYNVEDAGKLRLEDGRQITGHNDAGERLGQWGRGKLRFTDWNGDGKLDLIVGSIKRSSYPSPDRGLPYSRFRKKEFGLQVMLFENVGTNEKMVFKEPVQFQVDGKDVYLGAHSNAPEPCMLGDVTDGPNLLVGCESGKYFFFDRRHLTVTGIPE